MPKKILPSRRYDDLIALWRSIIKDPSATTEQRVEAGRQLQTVLQHQDKIVSQRQYAELSNPAIPTDPNELQKTIERLKSQAAGGA
jgi:hypothetical protein